MRRVTWAFLVAVVSVSCAVNATAQSTSSAWEGEWGSFTAAPSAHLRSPLGHGISIFGCKAEKCDFSVIAEEKTGHGSASGYVEIQSPTMAIAHLISVLNEEHCSLALQLVATEKVIKAKPHTADCTYFLTPNASFEHEYPLHSREHYVGDNIAACFVSPAPSQQELCTSQALADQAKEWQLLYLRVAELEAKPNELAGAQNARDVILTGCDHASDVGNCLQNGFAKSTEQLEVRQTTWLASVTQPGNAAKAEAEARTIEGSYRRSFKNGDIDGDHFMSTDALDIVPLSKGEIRFTLYLAFYNGHECSLEGRASFVRPGFFVYQEKEDPQQLGCILEIIPGKEGLKLADPTGECRMTSCGARGGYNGAAFSFKDRVVR